MSDLTWPWVYLGFLLCGTVLAFTMLLASSPSRLLWLASQPCCSPNWMSLWRLPIIAIGQSIYIYQGGLHQSSLGLLFCGFLLVVAGLILDRLDGKQAKAILKSLTILSNSPRVNTQEQWAWYLDQDENEEGQKIQVWRVVKITPQLLLLMPEQTFVPMFRLTSWPQAKVRPTIEAGAHSQDMILELTGIGEWLDPLIDKFNFHPVFLYLASLGKLNPVIAILMFQTDLVSTVIRTPFDHLPLFEKLQHYVRFSKASAFGKIKVVVHFVTLLAIMPVTAGWLNPKEQAQSYLIASSILLLSLIAGSLSVLSRLTLMDYLLDLTGLRRVFRALNKGFEH